MVQKLIQSFLDRVRRRVEAFSPAKVADLGCGEGIVAAELKQMAKPFAFIGVELNPEAAAAAKARHPDDEIRVGNILREDPPEEGWADVALCLEVLEHLEDPAAAVGQIARWTRHAAVISVPWEPYFRTGNLLRGKYLGQLGNHPEHIQQFTPRSLRRLLRGTFPVVEIEKQFPWLIAVCAKGPTP